MDTLVRVAFMSYAHENDAYDRGYLSRFRERLEGAVRVHLGDDKFVIFQDRSHIHPGHTWEDRINEYLSKASILIPILTPHYYKSPWCRKEFEYFWDKAEEKGIRPLIYPVYYIKAEHFSDAAQYPPWSMERHLIQYEYVDWRKLRELHIYSASVRRRLALLASDMKDTFAQTDFAQSTRHSIASPASSGSFERPLSAHSSGSYGPPLDMRMLPRARRFYGRGRDLAHVMDGLTHTNGSHIVCIEGPEGIGKSVLAAEAARRLHMDDSFRDGIAVALCSGVGDPLEILQDVLTRFDPQRRAPVQTNEPGLIAEAHRLLDGKDAAVILDDVEASPAIAHMIEALHTTGVALLITAKSQLALSQVISIKLTSLRRQDAISLLTDAMERRPPNEPLNEPPNTERS